MSTSKTQPKAERKRVLYIRQRWIARRLWERTQEERSRPMFSASPLHYELAQYLIPFGIAGMNSFHHGQAVA